MECESTTSTADGFIWPEQQAKKGLIRQLQHLRDELKPNARPSRHMYLHPTMYTKLMERLRAKITTNPDITGEVGFCGMAVHQDPEAETHDVLHSHEYIPRAGYELKKQQERAREFHIRFLSTCHGREFAGPLARPLIWT